MTGAPIGWWGFNKRKNSKRYDLLYNKGNNSRYVSNSKYAHSVIKIWKEYYNINAIKVGLFSFMERWFKARKILKKCNLKKKRFTIQNKMIKKPHVSPLLRLKK